MFKATFWAFRESAVWVVFFEFAEIGLAMSLVFVPSIVSWKRLASFSFLFALCFSLDAQNGCEDDVGNIYGPYEELVVSDDPCENFTCIPSAFSFVWVSNSEYLDDCGGEDDDEVDGEDWAELIEWLEEICASGDTLEVDFDVEEACAFLELIEACSEGDEEACEEVDMYIGDLMDGWDDDEEDDDEEDDDEEDDDEEDDDEEDDNEEDEGDEFDEEELDALIEWLEEICASGDSLEVDFDVEEACAFLELIEACSEGDEAACEEVDIYIGDLMDGWDDDEEDDEEEDDEEEDDEEEDEGDEFDEEELDALIEWLEEICASGDSLEVDFDVEEACAFLELIEACANGSEEACEELEMLLEELEDLWDEEDEEDEDEEDEDEEDEDEEESEDECEVEFEFEQAMDEDGVPLPYNIVAYVDEPEADTYYFWSFGDGNESDEPNPTHTYDEVGNYEVCLTVTQMVGNFLECTATYCDTLMIDLDGLVRQQLVLNILFPGQTINVVAEHERTLDVYPNPAADFFRIRAEVGIESAVVRTMDGRWVGRWVSNGFETMEVPCNAWPTGVYVLEVRTYEGVMRSRVLVQH